MSDYIEELLEKIEEERNKQKEEAYEIMKKWEEEAETRHGGWLNFLNEKRRF